MERLLVVLAGEIGVFQVVARYLQARRGIEVVQVGSCEEVLALCTGSRPALICLDHELPGTDGIACCSELKRTPRLADTPVILIASEEREDDLERCRAAGCDGLLTRPIDCQRFLDLGHRLIPSLDRREVRIHCRLTVQFRTGCENHYGSCWDLAMHGMYVVYDGDVVPGEPIETSFVISEESPSLVEAWGRVAWVNIGNQRRQCDLPEGFGVEFLDLSEDARTAISKFIEEG